MHLMDKKNGPSLRVNGHLSSIYCGSRPNLPVSMRYGRESSSPFLGWPSSYRIPCRIYENRRFPKTQCRRIVSVSLSHLFRTPVYTVRNMWAYQPGPHRREANKGFFSPIVSLFSTFLLRRSPYFFREMGSAVPFPRRPSRRILRARGISVLSLLFGMMRKKIPGRHLRK